MPGFKGARHHVGTTTQRDYGAAPTPEPTVPATTFF